MRRAEWALLSKCQTCKTARRAALCLAFAWFVLLPLGSYAADSILILNAAEFVLDGAITPPDAAVWQPQPLPDNWNRSRPGLGGNAWYRLRFELPHQPDQLYAVHVRKLSMNAGFYINGAFIGSGGRFEEPVARHWNRPQFFTISPGLLKQGANTLHVRLWAYPNSRGGLGEVTVGPESELRPHYERRYFLQIIFPQLCNIVIAALGLFAFVLWVRHRIGAVYVYFSVFTLLWAVRSTHMIIRDIPIPTFYWDIWVQSSFGWCALLFVVLAMRYSRLHRPRFEKILIAYAMLGPLVMYLAGPVEFHSVANNWSFVIVPAAIVFEGFLIREAWRTRTFVAALLGAVWALLIVASIHDGLVHRDMLAFDSFYFVSYVMVLLSFVVGWLLTNRFIQALKVAERLNVELERRVAQKHAELAQNFQRLQELEQEKAIAEERRRIMSDMHDGVGSQLIAAVQLVEAGEAPRAEVANEIRECLDSVRLTVDSLEETDGDLLAVLANFRYRLEGRLKRQNIRLDWQVREVPKLDSLTPQNVSHILRILQEAFTNIIKHARAKTIIVQTGVTHEHVFIRVADDGSGFAGDRQGHGIASMRRRALALGANLEITPSPSGTTLSLLIPQSA